jgi:hypothetical protein
LILCPRAISCRDTYLIRTSPVSLILIETRYRL